MIKKPFGIVPGGFCFYMYFVKNYKKKLYCFNILYKIYSYLCDKSIPFLDYEEMFFIPAFIRVDKYHGKSANFLRDKVLRQS